MGSWGHVPPPLSDTMTFFFLFRLFSSSFRFFSERGQRDSGHSSEDQGGEKHRGVDGQGHAHLRRGSSKDGRRGGVFLRVQDSDYSRCNHPFTTRLQKLPTRTNSKWLILEPREWSSTRVERRRGRKEGAY